MTLWNEELSITASDILKWLLVWFILGRMKNIFSIEY